MTNTNQKERFQTKIAMLEQNNQVLRNKCEEYLGELERTHKALDVAVDALKSVRKCLCEMPDPSGATILSMACESATIVKKVLEQITALEQKDVK